jgi:hypothetical protein
MIKDDWNDEITSWHNNCLNVKIIEIILDVAIFGLNLNWIQNNVVIKLVILKPIFKKKNIHGIFFIINYQ